jgi:hypothetical protein
MKPVCRQWILLVTGLIFIAVWIWADYFSTGRAHSGPSRKHVTQTRAEALLSGLDAFERDFGNCPTGNNASVVNALVGGNPRERNYLQTDGRSPSALNEQTQLVDAWGVPFQIEFPMTDSPIVRSAGSKRMFGDEDDLVFNRSEILKP